MWFNFIFAWVLLCPDGAIVASTFATFLHVNWKNHAAEYRREAMPQKGMPFLPRCHGFKLASCSL